MIMIPSICWMPVTIFGDDFIDLEKWLHKKKPKAFCEANDYIQKVSSHRRKETKQVDDHFLNKLVDYVPKLLYNDECGLAIISLTWKHCSWFVKRDFCSNILGNFLTNPKDIFCPSSQIQFGCGLIDNLQMELSCISSCVQAIILTCSMCQLTFDYTLTLLSNSTTLMWIFHVNTTSYKLLR